MCSVRTGSCGRSCVSTTLPSSSFVDIWSFQKKVILNGSWCTLHFRNIIQLKNSMEIPYIFVVTAAFFFGRTTTSHGYSRTQDTLVLQLTQTAASHLCLHNTSLIFSSFKDSPHPSCTLCFLVVAGNRCFLWPEATAESVRPSLPGGTWETAPHLPCSRKALLYISISEGARKPKQIISVSFFKSSLLSTLKFVILYIYKYR